MKLLLPWLVIFFISCNQQPFIREDELIRLMTRETDNRPVVDGYVILFLNETCSACQGDVMKTITQALRSNDKEAVVFYCKEDPIIQQAASRPNTRLYKVPIQTIQQAGVSQASSLFAEFEEGKIVYWSYINDGTVKKINNRIN